MKQLEGDRNFIAPPLRTAPVFGNIAGIMAGDQGDSDDAGAIPSLLSTKARDAGEMQDLYRRTLAADLTSYGGGELRADLAIEDIFSGGDGWGNKSTSLTESEATLKPTLGEENGSSDTESRLTDQSKRNLRFFHSDPKSTVRKSPSMGLENGMRPRSANGRGSLDQTARHMKDEVERMRNKPQQEVDELEIREDLRSWRLSGSIAS